MKLFNTLTKKLEEIKPNESGIITMYNCGPTVYSHQHIGNYRAYANWDILHRALVYLGYNVKRIMNITDVGHLTSDEDFGEDKMLKGARKLGVSDPYEVANFFTKSFLKDMYLLNMWSPSGRSMVENFDLSELKEFGWIRATASIEPMIEIIKSMEEKGYVYETEQAVYFDVTKYPEYTELSGQKLEDKLVGVRDDVNVDSKKKNPADFVLWMKRYGTYADHSMHWNSPWGDGFPGWHIECSAMGIEYLGQFISIHTGGIEHIPVHHTNERAQNYGALQKEVVNIWVHNEHMQAKGGEKLGKSLGNALTIDEVTALGYDPMDLRWLLISVNYKIPLKFSEEALDGAKNSRLGVINRLKEKLGSGDREGGVVLDEFKKLFEVALHDNLNMSEAFSIFLEVVKSRESTKDIFATVSDFDRVFGLRIIESLEEKVEAEIPSDIAQLLKDREVARNTKDFVSSDRLRDEILDKGYVVKDTPNGQVVEKQ
ncbi:cysteine--tRNA ligase [Candidatus Dojkabacteria bacterium]|nr:cysteine--tRNA ligase [Candidatus Dojkabacteria bacterium]